jgi:hypothetical protein
MQQASVGVQCSTDMYSAQRYYIHACVQNQYRPYCTEQYAARPTVYCAEHRNVQAPRSTYVQNSTYWTVLSSKKAAHTKLQRSTL